MRAPVLIRSIRRYLALGAALLTWTAADAAAPYLYLHTTQSDYVSRHKEIKGAGGGVRVVDPATYRGLRAPEIVERHVYAGCTAYVIVPYDYSGPDLVTVGPGERKHQELHYPKARLDSLVNHLRKVRSVIASSPALDPEQIRPDAEVALSDIEAIEKSQWLPALRSRYGGLDTPRLFSLTSLRYALMNLGFKVPASAPAQVSSPAAARAPTRLGNSAGSVGRSGSPTASNSVVRFGTTNQSSASHPRAREVNPSSQRTPAANAAAGRSDSPTATNSVRRSRTTNESRASNLRSAEANRSSRPAPAANELTRDPRAFRSLLTSIDDVLRDLRKYSVTGSAWCRLLSAPAGEMLVLKTVHGAVLDKKQVPATINETVRMR